MGERIIDKEGCGWNPLLFSQFVCPLAVLGKRRQQTHSRRHRDGYFERDRSRSKRSPQLAGFDWMGVSRFGRDVPAG